MDRGVCDGGHWGIGFRLVHAYTWVTRIGSLRVQYIYTCSCGTQLYLNYGVCNRIHEFYYDEASSAHKPSLRCLVRSSEYAYDLEPHHNTERWNRRGRTSSESRRLI
jgi:hypothetical protein